MANFRDLPLGTKVSFRLRPTFDLRRPRDAFKLARRLETRRLRPLGEGPLEPEITPATEAPRDFDLAQQEKAITLGAKRFGALGLEWE